MKVSRRWFILVAIFAVIFELYYFGEYVINEPAAQAQKGIVEQQVSQVSQPQSVKQVRVISGNKTTSAFITQVFTSSLGFDNLREFYASEFSRLGFSLVKTNIRKFPDMDKVNASVSYCKGDYTAILRYKGLTDTRDRKIDEWTYAIDLSWWNRGCEPD